MTQYADQDPMYDAQFHSSEPVDPNWTESPFSSGAYAQEQNPMLGEMPEHPLHVKVVSTASEQVAAEHTALTSFSPPLAGSANPVQICPHKYHRLKAKSLWTIPLGYTVWLAHKPDGLSTPTPATTNFQLVNGMVMPDYDGQQPLYAVYTGTGLAPSQPAVPASGVAQQNTNSYPVTVVVSGGTATVTTVNGVVVGAGDGTFVVPAYGSIAVTYTVAPTWLWSSATANVPPFVSIMDETYGTVQ
jgi:hypothetical protein